MIAKASRSLAVIAVIASSARAAPHKVVVLPLDGDAPPAMRQALATDLAAAARADGGTITTGSTTFDETAAAVGCDPTAPACATTVLATLGVDEIVFGSASADGSTTHVKLARVARDSRQDRAFDLTADSDADAQVRTLYGAEPPPPPPAPPPIAPPPIAPAPPPKPSSTFFDTRDRELGVAFAAGGGLALAIGLALWASESSLQSQINNAPTSTLDDLTALRMSEDHASNYAVGGNILVVLGLAAGGVGAYYLWTDHRARATVAPADHGAAVTLEGTW